MIILDTNVVSETLRAQPDERVMHWLARHDAELALSTVVIAQIAYGIDKIRPERRARRLAHGLDAWRARFSGRIFPFTEEAALAYGTLMGHAARAGRLMAARDGMIAAITKVHGSPLATRNHKDYEHTGLDPVDRWGA